MVCGITGNKLTLNKNYIVSEKSWFSEHAISEFGKKSQAVLNMVSKLCYQQQNANCYGM